VAALPTSLQPASCRLMDATQVKLGRAVGECAGVRSAVKSALESVVLWTKGITLSQACAVTLVFEGMAAEVEVQQRTVASLVLESKGVWGGASASHRGYQMTFAIAYIRDFLLDFRVLAESFETFAPWSVLSDIWPAVTSAVQAEHVALGLPGQPCLTVRLTQLYHQGGVLYMYLAACMGSLGPAEALEAYHRLEEAARRAILHVGGSLSHHHGVGKIRSSHLEATQSPAFSQAVRCLKTALDPQNLFAARNGVWELDAARHGVWEINAAERIVES